jgi:hypothetical protein
MATITAANSVFMLSIANLFPTPIQLQGYAVDDAFTIDDLTMAEVRMGVDGKMSAGWVPAITMMHVAFEADSASLAVITEWMTAQKQVREIYKATGNIALSGVSTEYELKNGVLVIGKTMPDVKKVLGPQKFTIAWETVNSFPV